MRTLARLAGASLLLGSALAGPVAMAAETLRGGGTATLPLPDGRSSARILTITVEAYDPAGGSGEIAVRSGGAEIGRVGIFPNEPFRAEDRRTMRFDLPVPPGTVPAGARGIEVTFDAPPAASLVLGAASLR